MESWLSPRVQDGSSSFVDSDVSLVDDMEGTSDVEDKDDDH